VGGACLFFRYVCPFLHSQTRDGLRGKKSQLKKLLSLFFGVLGWVGWVGLGWLCGGDMFILSVRLSILAFSNWRWFEENCRPNKKKYHLYFLEFLVGLGWVGLGWVGLALWGGHVYSFGTFVFLHSQTGDGLRKIADPIRKNIIFIFWSSWLGWVGLGWVGLALWGGHVYSFGTFVFLHSQTGDGLRKIADPMRKTSSLFFGSRGLVGLGWVGLAS